MKHRQKQTGEIADIMTFDELVAHGRKQTPTREAMPWIFTWDGCVVSHERDDCYLVSGCGCSVSVMPGVSVVRYETDGRLRLRNSRNVTDHWEPVEEATQGPTEAEMIEATEKSAALMLGLAARARAALRIEEDNEKLKKHVAKLNVALSEQAAKVSKLQQELHTHPERDRQAIEDLRKAFDAEDYDFLSLATMAIQKIRDLDRALTESKGEVKIINRDRENLRDAVNALRERVPSQEKPGVSGWNEGDSPQSHPNEAVFWNPGNLVVQDHRNGTVVQPETDQERAKRGLPPFTPEQPQPKTLKLAIAEAINRFSAENGSDTPDFILADYLLESLDAFDVAVKRRTVWYNPPSGPG